MTYYFRAVDYIKWVWKSKFNVDKSKTQIKKDLEQGAVRLNDRKIKVDDIFEIDDKQNF